jgi:hypothetical protein
VTQCYRNPGSLPTNFLFLPYCHKKPTYNGEIFRQVFLDLPRDKFSLILLQMDELVIRAAKGKLGARGKKPNA